MNTNTTVSQPSQSNRIAQPEHNSRSRGYLQPSVNIVENQDGYLLEAEMPGVGREGLEVLLEGNMLTLVGKRTYVPPTANCVYRESNDRDYRRVFELDPAIDTAKITARMENGMLHLTLPKAEQVKPRKITVE